METNTISILSEDRLEEIEALVANLSYWQRKKLYSNTHKGPWSGTAREFLLARFLDEIMEFADALEQELHPDEVWKEVADCANILSMIADNYEAAYGERTTPEKEPAVATA